jgi:periplasmic protein TonB
MEVKKTEKADLTKKSGLFFSIGLLITMALVLWAFESTQTDDNKIDELARSTNTFEEVVEVPPTDIPPPAAPIIQQPQIIEVPDEEEIKEDLKINVEVNEETRPETVIVEAKVEEEETDQIFTVVEESAAPKGGMAAFYKYVSEKMKYPAQARRMGTEGRVFVEFIVGKDGSISDVRAVRGIGGGCDEEAVRVLQSAPSWTPGKQRGKPVKQKMVIPIIFKLG